MLSACDTLPPPTDMPAVPAPPPVLVKELVQPTVAPTLALRTPSPVAEALSGASLSPTPTPTLRPIPTRVPSHDLAALNEYQRGVAYVALNNAAYLTPESDRSLDELFATGAN